MKFIFSLFSTLGLLALSSPPALARDGAHLVCTGFMDLSPSPDNYGLAVQFDEGRASDGASRIEVLSTVWARNLYQGVRINRSFGFGENGVILIASKEDAKKVFFDGKYNIVRNQASGTYSLVLNGQLNLDPGAANNETKAISTTLNCVDISN